MSETPQRNENEFIPVEYTGAEINTAIGYALQVRAGTQVVPAARGDEYGHNIRNTYVSTGQWDEVVGTVTSESITLANKDVILKSASASELQPTTNSNLTTKKYVDDELDKKVDKNRILSYIDYAINNN